MKQKWIESISNDDLLGYLKYLINPYTVNRLKKKLSQPTNSTFNETLLENELKAIFTIYADAIRLFSSDVLPSTYIGVLTLKHKTEDKTTFVMVTFDMKTIYLNDSELYMLSHKETHITLPFDLKEYDIFNFVLNVDYTGSSLYGTKSYIADFINGKLSYQKLEKIIKNQIHLGYGAMKEFFDLKTYPSFVITSNSGYNDLFDNDPEHSLKSKIGHPDTLREYSVFHTNKQFLHINESMLLRLRFYRRYPELFNRANSYFRNKRIRVKKELISD